MLGVFLMFLSTACSRQQACLIPSQHSGTSSPCMRFPQPSQRCESPAESTAACIAMQDRTAMMLGAA